MLNSPRYISGFQTLTPCRSRQGTVMVKLQNFSLFWVIITLFEMINEPRLKTETYVTCFLFFLSSKSTSKGSSLSDGHFTIDKCLVYTIVLNAPYEIRSCLLLNDFMFSCCLLSCIFVFISNAESTLNVAQWVWMVPLTRSANWK